MKAPFVELHARSAFSFLHGASQPETMVRQAAALGYDALAITDLNGFYASARAHHAARECGIRAIVGTCLKHPDGSTFPVLCATRNGYRMMSRHLTDLHLMPENAVPYFAQGDLIALTGDRDGAVCRAILGDNRRQALIEAEKLIATFGHSHVYVELNRHGLPDDGRLNRALIDLASHLKLPLLASNAPLHATKGDRRLADAFTCLRHHVPLDGAGRLLAANGERHLKSPHDMARLFRDIPEAVNNTRGLAERVSFTLENLDYRFPDFHDHRGHPLSIPEQSTLLRRLAYAGATRRYGRIGRKVKTQMEHELAMIQRLGFPGYFLIVHDLIEFARGRGILCQGRGSAANSVVCYALGITAVDPIGGGLLFERFLSGNRQTWPDIDIDFPSGERREEVIQYVFRKYGARGAAMTANVITYRKKSAMREMSKVLGFPPSVADRFSETPGRFRGDAPKDGNASRESEFEEIVSSIIPPSHPRLPALDHLYHAVLGLPRHLGQHSGGMIICNHGLDAVVPLQPATMPGRTIVQWDKDDCEDMGLVKIDLLGLGMLAAMEESIRICEVRGKPIDLAKIPKEDPKVYDLLCEADTIGTFQVESRAQMATLPILRPRTFYDLAIEVAIIRPGPIVGDLLHPYLNRRSGREAVDCIHPLCEATLRRTLGVPLYQEQVLRIAMDVAGFSGEEADELRRAMAFKRNDERMQKVTAKLRQRMGERGIEPEVQEKVVDAIGSFALYGFPESHAISFALIAYASCWFKVYHPAEFYCGLIHAQPMGFYSVNTLLQDARRHGVRALPVSCVHSGPMTTVVDDHHLRLGFDRIKGLSQATIGRIVAGRPFADLRDFIRKVQPTVREKRLLAKAGALNDLPDTDHRRQAMWQVELPWFDDLARPQPSASPLPAMTLTERLSADFSTQEASAGVHPMHVWRREHGSLRILRSADLHRFPHGMPVTVAGMVICRQRPGTAKGHCFISLEDECGIANLFVRRELFQRRQRVISSEPFLLVRGKLQRTEGNQPTVYVLHLEPLNNTDAGVVPKSHDYH
ncbi:MAG: error-prone DNA polymerase [Luteolibacter sp.]